jgi:hypothetical protein
MSHQTAVNGEAAWLASDLSANETWERYLASAEVAAIARGG